MKKNILYIADGADGGAGGGDGASAGDAALGGREDGGQQNAEGGGAEGEGGEAEKKVEAAPQLTAESLAQAMKAAGVGAQATDAGGGKKQYTQEDFDKAFHVIRPTKEQITKLLAGGDEAVAIFTEMLHGAARQATVMSAYQQQELKDAILAELNPIKASFAEQQEQRLRAQFEKENEDLMPFKQVCEAVVAEIRQKGEQFKDAPTAFKEVRARSIKMIQSLPGFENWKPGKQTQAGAKSNMPPLARGGGSGGAAAGQGKQATVAGNGQSRGQPSAGASVFD